MVIMLSQLVAVHVLYLVIVSASAVTLQDVPCVVRHINSNLSRFSGSVDKSPEHTINITIQQYTSVISLFSPFFVVVLNPIFVVCLHVPG